MKKFNSDLEVYKEMEQFENHTIREIVTKEYLLSKSFVGTIIEQEIFEYKPNPKPVPDIENLGIEIKSTPVKKVRNRYVSKERLVLNLINYRNENWNNIYESSFWKKNQKLLIIFYEYFYNTDPFDFKLFKSIIYNYPEVDFKIIQNDWDIISKKVREGKAHEISERDTLYLAACTKGASSKSVQRQPFSDIIAKQRAYSLKSSYMTVVFNEYVLENKKDERIINDAKILSKKFDFQDYVIELFKPFLGKSIAELVAILKINASINAKSINSIIIKRIIGIKNQVENVYEFKKAGIIPKTIRLEENGLIKESMSFPTFKFTEIVKTEWEESNIFDIFANHRFLFIIFQKNRDEYILKDVMFWAISEDDLEQCKSVYEKTQEVIRKGVIITQKGSKTKNNLPAQKDNDVMHVRPHASNKNDTYDLPDGDSLTKQCFWLNREYIIKIVNKK
jgi:DNA mismatch repair protein MutH